MKLFKKVAIVGLGLIGGSIALTIKKRRLADKVIGVSRRKKTVALAKKMRLIDKGAQDINIIKEADLVILATPVSTILKLAPKISKIIKKGCIVTDVGSTKQEIVSKLGENFSRYVGSHPLAGSEKRGIINTCPDLFTGSLCILTPVENTDKEAQDKIKRFWNKIGAKVVILTPALHDKILSFTSHLPHIAAFSLMGVIPLKYLKFASSGLKDATRIAASEAGLWCDIFLSNQKNMSKAIDSLQKILFKIKSAINKKDRALLIRILKQAKKKRDNLGF